MICDPAEPVARALRAAIAAECGIDPANADPRVQPAANPAFGDLQANFAMALAKQCGRNLILSHAFVEQLHDRDRLEHLGDFELRGHGLESVYGLLPPAETSSASRPPAATEAAQHPARA